MMAAVTVNAVSGRHPSESLEQVMGRVEDENGLHHHAIELDALRVRGLLDAESQGSRVELSSPASELAWETEEGTVNWVRVLPLTGGAAPSRFVHFLSSTTAGGTLHVWGGYSRDAIRETSNAQEATRLSETGASFAGKRHGRLHITIPSDQDTHTFPFAVSRIAVGPSQVSVVSVGTYTTLSADRKTVEFRTLSSNQDAYLHYWC